MNKYTSNALDNFLAIWLLSGVLSYFTLASKKYIASSVSWDGHSRKIVLSLPAMAVSILRWFPNGLFYQIFNFLFSVFFIRLIRHYCRRLIKIYCTRYSVTHYLLYNLWRLYFDNYTFSIILFVVFWITCVDFFTV